MLCTAGVHLVNDSHAQALNQPSATMLSWPESISPHIGQGRARQGRAGQGSAYIHL